MRNQEASHSELALRGVVEEAHGMGLGELAPAGGVTNRFNVEATL